MFERSSNSIPNICSVVDFPIWKRLLFGITRRCLFFFFCYLPYGKITRVNKPDLRLPFIWASSHHNFLCDIVPGAYEGRVSVKFLAKNTLFFFPLGFFMKFFGAIPLYRMQDQTGKSGTEANRQSFRAAIDAMKKMWPVAIFPEGVSIISPGLVLPFKPGIGKLAVSAELESNFQLGLRIVPVALEYGRRSEVCSGIFIRYGDLIELKDYEVAAKENERAAVNKVMEALTAAMIKIFPHFKSNEDELLAYELVSCGVIPHRLELAQTLLTTKDSEALSRFRKEARETVLQICRNGFSLPNLGFLRRWKKSDTQEKKLLLSIGLLFAPVVLFDTINSFLAELALGKVLKLVATDETEMMTYRIALSPLLVMPIYFLQGRGASYWFHISFLGLLSYLFGSIGLWWLAQRNRKNVGLVLALVRQSMSNWNEERSIRLNLHLQELEKLRQHLNHLQNGSGNGSEHSEDHVEINFV